MFITLFTKNQNTGMRKEIKQKLVNTKIEFDNDVNHICDFVTQLVPEFRFVLENWDVEDEETFITNMRFLNRVFHGFDALMNRFSETDIVYGNSRLFMKMFPAQGEKIGKSAPIIKFWNKIYQTLFGNFIAIVFPLPYQMHHYGLLSTGEINNFNYFLNADKEEFQKIAGMIEGMIRTRFFKMRKENSAKKNQQLVLEIAFLIFGFHTIVIPAFNNK